MQTVTETARGLGVTPATIRRWAGEFGEFLSEHATPPKGETRLFTEIDAAKLALVGEMRRANIDAETIGNALAAGELGQWPPDDRQRNQDVHGSEQQGEGIPLALVTQLTARAASLEGELKATREERDHLRQQLEAARQTAQDARDRALVAETKLQAVSIMQGAETPAAGNLLDADQDLLNPIGAADTTTKQDQPTSWRERLARWIGSSSG